MATGAELALNIRVNPQGLPILDEIAQKAGRAGKGFSQFGDVTQAVANKTKAVSGSMAQLGVQLSRMSDTTGPASTSVITIARNVANLAVAVGRASGSSGLMQLASVIVRLSPVAIAAGIALSIFQGRLKTWQAEVDEANKETDAWTTNLGRNIKELEAFRKGLEFKAASVGLDEVAEAVEGARHKFEGSGIAAGQLKAELEKIREARIDEVMKRIALETDNATKGMESLDAAAKRIREIPQTIQGLVKSLPEALQSMIPKDLRIEFDKAAFVAEITALKTQFETQFPATAQKLIELDVLPENVQEMEALFAKMTKTETKVIDVKASGGGGGSPPTTVVSGAGSTAFDVAIAGLQTLGHNPLSAEIITRQAFELGQKLPITFSPQVVESPAVPLRDWEAAFPARMAELARSASGQAIEFDLSSARAELEALQASLASLAGIGLGAIVPDDVAARAGLSGGEGIRGGFGVFGLSRSVNVAPTTISPASELREQETLAIVDAIRRLQDSIERTTSATERNVRATEDVGRTFRSGSFGGQIAKAVSKALERSFGRSGRLAKI